MNLRDVLTAGKLKSSKETILVAETDPAETEVLVADGNNQESVNSPLFMSRKLWWSSTFGIQ
jgi:hypothetical protein